jgi:L-asparaginase/Glu-tRNA(Gln) amidotransferase subunit D
MTNATLLILTGGTFDSKRYGDPSNPPDIVETLPYGESLIPGVIRNLGHDVDEFTWFGDLLQARMNRDSKSFTDAEIAELAQVIMQDCDHSNFIITHGTDALAENAFKLQQALTMCSPGGSIQKKVAFVGSMVPLSMDNSVNNDGVASIEFAITNIANQPDGVWVVARSENNEIGFHNPAMVTKDFNLSRQRLAYSVQNRVDRAV